MKATNRLNPHRATVHAPCGRRHVVAILLMGLAVLLGIAPAFADEFYFTRTRALGGGPDNGETGLFRWNDATNAQSQIGGDGTPLRHPINGRMTVDAIATDLAGTLYGFAIDDISTAGTFLPWSTEFADQCTTTQRSTLVSINTATAEIEYVGTSWLSGRQITGAAFDGQGRLWAYDCVSASVLQVSPATGGIIGAPVPVNLVGLAGYDFDLDFAANGTGIIGYGGLQFRAFDPDTGWVADVPTNSQNNGFDGTFQPPYMVPGVAFTNHLSARNGSPQAEACRLNIGEIRGTDELGHVNDPFFANPSIAHKDVDKYNPPNVTNHNAGPGDLARVGGPALPDDCFYDWGDAPNSYATLLAGNGARHTIVADSPYLGASLPDFEIDGQPNAGATGDDSIGTGDEDGAVVPALSVGATVQIEVAAGNVGPGTLLQGWIDWAGDGSFAQAGDQVLVDTAVVSGINTFDIAVPATATVGTTYARFRIANQAGLGFVGLAGSGEVEDHQVEVTAGETDLAITKDDGQTAYTPGGTVVYEIVATNNGPVAVLGAQINDPLPNGISDASWTCADDGGGSACGAANGTGAIATTADLPAGASVTYTLTMTIPSGFGGDLVNTATVDPPAGMTDADPANNTASDTNTEFTSPPGPDPSVCNIADNGSFESPNIQTDPEGPGDNTQIVNGYAVWRTTTNPISGWETAAGTIDILRHFNNASNGLQSIDLWGTAPATIRQTFTGLVPGAQYTFSVDYSGLSAANSIAVVQLGNGVGAAPVTLATLQPAADAVSNGNTGIPDTPSFSVTWSTYRHTFIAAGTEATVQFVNNTAPATANTGLFVDNFSFAGDPCANLGIVKTVTPEEVRSGEAVVYTLQVTNDGPDPADGARVTDPGVPDSLECTALTCAADAGAVCPGAPTPAQLATGLEIPTFPVGGAVTLELTCTVTATGL
ncbi:GEVED domain-containing protein [Luteimonas suaedae]|uniref:GEVED domain-containing protein n=1 Tax=Luteimonas suaedae TaxID=2605430 RepID=UPI001659E6C1|nr:GEVED domain-containing protein [Luteimonas suaedae]